VDLIINGSFWLGTVFGGALAWVLLSHLFDTVGRRKVITLCYVASGVLLIGTGLLFNAGVLSAATPTACWMVVFLFASAARWRWRSSTRSAPASAASPARPCSASWSRPARRSTSSTATCSPRW
jgi:hypothetical protein